jgi:8-oxo-dGTP pyrophosphatase MutT (NUDIX family)
MIAQEQIIGLLDAYHSPFEEEIFFRKLMLELAADYPACCLRSRLQGHFTASAWVFGPQMDQVLLLHHRALNKWLQPGGHLEADDHSLLEAARREALEECGLRGLAPLAEGIFDLDVHVIPVRGEVPEHLHHDIRFAFVAHDEALQADFSEVKDLRWVPLADLHRDEGLQQALRRMVRKS